jgi:hypothetical protein
VSASPPTHDEGGSVRLLPLAVLFLAGCSSLALRACAEDWQPRGKPAAPPSQTIETTRCAEHDPNRRAFFGDLHVHTRYSFDARSYDVLGGPDAAYRFARGEKTAVWPYTDERDGGRFIQLERPLDFAAVTDHAEWIGETTVCTDERFAGYKSDACKRYRGELPAKAPLPGFPATRMLALIGVLDRRSDICGDDKSDCRAALLSTWRDTQETTERHHDHTRACSFTALHGWEWSFSPGRAKVHRNVIFRNHIVPELPISALEQNEVLGLWERLEAECNNNGSGCEAIAIPHNPNVSNGRMFTVPYRDEREEEQRRQASLRARMEPLVEMMQIKGESECRSGMYGVGGEDEFCEFEKIRSLGTDRFEDCEQGFGAGAIAGSGCESRLDYARYAVIEGMRERDRIGVNPYRIGFIGGTDNHNAAPGDVDERNWAGCCGSEDGTTSVRLADTPIFAGKSSAWRNPGGLMGVWAEENARDALFDAMKRRETFATSGPRIQPRMFAGWNLPADLCAHADFAARGYRDGVTMGAVLGPADNADAAPTFVVSALRDPGTSASPGGLLERLQIIKVWAGDDGSFQQRVYHAAGHTETVAGVDPQTCLPHGAGHDALCATWTDPDFNAESSAAYYLRVLETPSCRWHQRQCLAFAPGARPGACDDPDLAKIIQERAWTSPIWYEAKLD